MWHLIFHAFVRVLIESQREEAVPTAAPRTGNDELKSDVKQLKEILARGSKMRQQTEAERDADPTTFGYARFPLTENEREGIERRIDFLEEIIRRIKKQSN